MAGIKPRLPGCPILAVLHSIPTQASPRAPALGQLALIPQKALLSPRKGPWRNSCSYINCRSYIRTLQGWGLRLVLGIPFLPEFWVPPLSAAIFPPITSICLFNFLKPLCFSSSSPQCLNYYQGKKINFKKKDLGFFQVFSPPSWAMPFGPFWTDLEKFFARFPWEFQPQIQQNLALPWHTPALKHSGSSKLQGSRDPFIPKAFLGLSLLTPFQVGLVLPLCPSSTLLPTPQEKIWVLILMWNFTEMKFNEISHTWKIVSPCRAVALIFRSCVCEIIWFYYKLLSFCWGF